GGIVLTDLPLSNRQSDLVWVAHVD
ncbi:MAG: hypothetical protein UZ13_00299, partial [Chloroflexi bacterium OLB13]